MYRYRIVLVLCCMVTLIYGCNDNGSDSPDNQSHNNIPTELTITVQEDTIGINGTTLSPQIHLSELKKVMGKWSRVEDDDYYIWDDLGFWAWIPTNTGNSQRIGVSFRSHNLEGQVVVTTTRTPFNGILMVDQFLVDCDTTLSGIINAGYHYDRDSLGIFDYYVKDIGIWNINVKYDTRVNKIVNLKVSPI